MSQQALFIQEGSVYSPTPLTTGPWTADAMHGGPPSALVGHVVTQHREEGEHVARITVELERPVPLLPLHVHATRRQVSGRVAHVDVQVQAQDQTVVTGRALLLRVKPLPEPGWVPSPLNVQVPGPERTVKMPQFVSGNLDTVYHRDGVEHRMESGSFESHGPASTWVKLLQPLVLGEPTSGLCRVLAAADFGSGVSAVYGAATDGIGLINADLTVVLQREPQGEWVGLESETRVAGSGSAVAITTLADEAGELGVATQSLLSIRVS